jgi:hypothetical protein
MGAIPAPGRNTNMLQAGDRVRHKRLPEWGLGQVVETRPGYVTIFFVEAGLRQFAANTPELAPAGGEGAHPLLDNLSAEPAKGNKYLSLEQATAKFLKRFPQGFEDPAYLSGEREPKEAAHRLALELLDEAEVAKLLEAGDSTGIGERARKLVNATNLVFPAEKAAFADAVRDAERCAALVPALVGLVHGEGEFRPRFEAWCEALKAAGLSKWPLATYFGFLYLPDSQVFVKPTVSQTAAQVCAFDLKYAAEPNWVTYSAAVRLAEYLREALAGMQPRDLIDVQAFMWVVSRRETKPPARARKAAAGGGD